MSGNAWLAAITVTGFFGFIFAASMLLAQRLWQGWNKPDPRDHSTQLSIWKSFWSLLTWR